MNLKHQKPIMQHKDYTKIKTQKSEEEEEEDEEKAGKQNNNSILET